MSPRPGTGEPIHDPPAGRPPRRSRPPGRPPGGPPARSGLLRYVLAWASGGALIVAAALVFLDRGEEDVVTLPPVRQIQLTAAARVASCELRTGDGSDVLGVPLAGAPADGPVRPGVYDEPPQARGLVAALRRGVIVIVHRPDLPDEVVQELQALQKALPAGTIVTPQAVPTRYAVAAVGWGAALGCEQYSRAAVDAIRLFRGRFVGSGPDSPG